MKKKNGGFTLVELIVAIAILSIVALGAASLMTVSSNFYAKQTALQRIQYTAQIAMTQIQEEIIDADEGLAWDDSLKTLYSVHKDESAVAGTLNMYRFDSSDQTIYWATCTAAENLPVTIDWKVLAERVTDLSAGFTPDLAHPDMVRIQMSLEFNTKTWSGSESFALRNHPACAESYAELWELIK